MSLVERTSRRTLLKGLFAFEAVLTLTVAGQALAQTTLMVDDDGAECPGATFTTIQAAAAGDIIEVCAGTYNENVTINKNLTLVSENGRGSTTIEGIPNAAQLGTIFKSVMRDKGSPSSG